MQFRPSQVEPVTDGVTEVVIREFFAGTVSAIPRVLMGIVFLTFAVIIVKLVLAVVRSVLTRIYPESERLIVDLLVAVVGLFLWFAVALALLKIVGMGDIAANLGTAAGFIGLGIAFALREMIADTVAGVYLLRDPDFNVGDVVNTASVTGTVVDIDLRKTRLQTEDGELTVLANRDVEKKWTTEPVEAGSDGPSLS